MAIELKVDGSVVQHPEIGCLQDIGVENVYLHSLQKDDCILLVDLAYDVHSHKGNNHLEPNLAFQKFNNFPLRGPAWIVRIPIEMEEEDRIDHGHNIDPGDILQDERFELTKTGELRTRHA